MLTRVAAARPQFGEWVVGAGWNHNRWGGRLPRRQDLDPVLGDRPAYLAAHGEHIALVNTAALRRVGWWPEPPARWRHGVDRDAEGPTGIVREDAAGVVAACIPDLSPDEWRRGLDRAAQALAAAGLVGATTMCRANAARLGRVAAWHRGHGGLRLQVFAADPEPGGRAASSRVMAAAQGFLAGADPAWMRLTGRKLWLDGMLGSRTAWMVEPYGDDPGVGIRLWDDDALADELSWLAGHGWSAALHAIGDAAVAQALRVLAAAGWQTGAAVPRLEHAQTIRPEDVPAFSRLGIAASMQPVHLLQDRWAASSALGPRVAWTFALRTLRAAGAAIVLGSDAPVETPDVVVGLTAAVRRARAGEDPWHPEQALTPEEALAGYTRVPAALDRRIGGAVAPGAPADFTVFDRDPRTALRRGEPFRVRGTIVAGRWVHRTG
jgi:predicted amidohydrolase YtcJ